MSFYRLHVDRTDGHLIAVPLGVLSCDIPKVGIAVVTKEHTVSSGLFGVEALASVVIFMSTDPASDGPRFYCSEKPLPRVGHPN